MDLQVACWQHVNVGGGRSQPADIFSSGQGKQAIRFFPVFNCDTSHILEPLSANYYLLFFALIRWRSRINSSTAASAIALGPNVSLLVLFEPSPFTKGVQ